MLSDTRALPIVALEIGVGKKSQVGNLMKTWLIMREGKQAVEQRHKLPRTHAGKPETS